MAIISVVEHKRDSARQLKQDGSYLVPAEDSTRYFQVNVDDPATPHSEIYAHADIPKLFEPHPENDSVIVKKVAPKQGDDDESYVIEVQVDYDDEYTGEDPEEPEDNNPLNRPTVIRGGFAEYDQVMVKDIYGNLIRNKAKDFFNPPVTRKGGALRFSMTKNFASLNLALLKAYKNAINSDVFFGQAARTVRIANITFDRNVEQMRVSEEVTTTIVYFSMTFEFELAEESLNDGTWRKVIENKGMRQLISNQLIEIYGKDALKVNEPQYLTENGLYESNPDNVNYCTFDVYRELPFAALGLL